MNISFTLPFTFHLTVVETDDYLPSMKVDIEVSIEQFQHAFRYNGSFWIDCLSWDKFVHSLSNLAINENVSLIDMNDSRILSLRRKDDQQNEVTWEYCKADIGGKLTTQAICTSVVDNDCLTVIVQQFKDFPIWW